jgi:hypothetical protein
MRIRLIQIELKYSVNLCDEGVAHSWNWENKILETANVTFVIWPCLYFQQFRNRKYFTFAVIPTLDVSPLLYFQHGKFGDTQLRNTKRRNRNFPVPFKRHNLPISAHVPAPVNTM